MLKLFQPHHLIKESRMNMQSQITETVQVPFLFYFYLFTYLFAFPGLVTLSIPHTEKLHCRRNITSKCNIKCEYCHKIILGGAGKKNVFQIKIK